MIVNASSKRSTRWSNGKPKAPELGLVPAGAEAEDEPAAADSSTVAACLASSAGLWKFVHATSGPSSIRCVTRRWPRGASRPPTVRGPADRPAVEEVLAEPDRVEAELLDRARHVEELRPADLALDLGQLEMRPCSWRSAAFVMGQGTGVTWRDAAEHGPGFVRGDRFVSYRSWPKPARDMILRRPRRAQRWQQGPTGRPRPDAARRSRCRTSSKPRRQVRGCSPDDLFRKESVTPRCAPRLAVLGLDHRRRRRPDQPLVVAGMLAEGQLYGCTGLVVADQRPDRGDRAQRDQLHVLVDARQVGLVGGGSAVARVGGRRRRHRPRPYCCGAARGGYAGKP